MNKQLLYVITAESAIIIYNNGVQVQAYTAQQVVWVTWHKIASLLSMDHLIVSASGANV